MASRSDSPNSPSPDPETSKASFSVRIVVTGRVQGVGFRYFTYGIAQKMRVGGWVRNLPDGNVEIQADGPRSLVENFIDEIRRGPALARVADVKTDWSQTKNPLQTFEILAS
jgi:acylphosphatase